ncbi:unnamed protein product [Rotaria sordida]|uniref:Uncharacterized protein n=1 Tax=Rotaria sordida TaxID=392033 RepID=A0A814UDC9_9BILA|nr:unnamed protein product [Rotaria sordida]
MSDKFIPHYLRGIDDTSNDREPYQQQKWSRTAIKAKINVELRQKVPPFVVSTAIYKIVHVNKYTSMEEPHLLVNHVQQCTQFTIDIESEKSNAQLALIQIQTIPPRLPLLVILIELQHLSSNNLPTYLIEPVTNEQPEYEEISNDEQEMNDKSLVNDIELIINDNDENKPTNDVERKPTTTKHRLTHQQRSKASNQRRNRKRNNTHRIRRYQHYITRSMYYKFTMPSIKKILKQHHINYVDVKEFDGMLIIGVKNSLIQQQYQDQIPEDMFDRKHYKNHQHHHE